MNDLVIEKKPISQNQSSSKVKTAPKEVDYSKYQRGAHTQAPKGYLVETPLWQTPFVMVEDTFDNIKSLGKGLQGKSDDHRMGKVNDLGLQACGLGIAGYLASTKVLPVKKGMEFVGFASFLASMALFPVLFIQKPIEALYGFNINQKYVDSFGRKKDVHRDPQYTPFDLYSPEKLNAVGDRMGIDKNMENRQGIIKEKMTKISIQADTIWMLTAGLAVPAMSALLASQAEKLLEHGIRVVKTNTLDEKMKNLSEIKGPSDEETKKLTEFLNHKKETQLNEKFADELAVMITGNENVRIKDSFKSDLKEMLKSNPVPSVADFFGDIKIDAVSSEDSNKKISFTLGKNEIKAALEKAASEKEDLNNNVSLFGEKDAPKRDKIKNVLTTLYKEKAIQNDSFANDRSIRDAADTSFQNIFDSKIKNEPMTLTDSNIKKLEEAYKHFYVFRKKSDVLQKYIAHKVGDNENSIAAIEWKKASDRIFKAFDFSDAEIKKSKESTSQARKILEEKFDNIAKGDDAKYKETVEKIATAIRDYTTEMDKSPIKKDFVEAVKETSADIYGDLSEQLAKVKDDKGENFVFKKTCNNLTNHFETAPKIEAEGNEKKAYDDAYNGLKNWLIKCAKNDGVTPEQIKEQVEKYGNLTDEVIEKVSVENGKENASRAAQKAAQLKAAEKQKCFPNSMAYAVSYDAENRIVGGKSSLNKILHGLDLFKRIHSKEIGNAIDSRNYCLEPLKPNATEQEIQAAKAKTKDKVIGYMKYFLMEGDIGTHTVKADIPQKEVYKDVMSLLYNVGQSDITPAFEKRTDNAVRESAAIKNKQEHEKQKAVSDAIADYKANLFDNVDLDKSTREAMGKANLSANGFKENLFNMFNKFANYEYRFKTEHKFHPIKDETILRKQFMVGETLSNFVHKNADRKYNTRVWFKMAGIAAIGAGAIALISPLFFGKAKPSQTDEKEVKANG